MTDKHTPKPWRLGLTVQNDGSLAIMAGDERVALVDNPEADGPLIAAAPELLKALKGLLDSGRGSDEIAHALDIPIDRIWDARKALEKAEKEDK